MLCIHPQAAHMLWDKATPTELTHPPHSWHNQMPILECGISVRTNSFVVLFGGVPMNELKLHRHDII